MEFRKKNDILVISYLKRYCIVFLIKLLLFFHIYDLVTEPFVLFKLVQLVLKSTVRTFRNADLTGLLRGLHSVGFKHELQMWTRISIIVSSFFLMYSVSNHSFPLGSKYLGKLP